MGFLKRNKIKKVSGDQQLISYSLPFGMLITTECLVLRRLEYGDSSIIATVLTPDEGKLTVMVRGARKSKSKFAGLFEVGNVLQLICYLKPNRELQNVKEASYAEKLFSLRDSLEKMAMMSAAMELTSQLVHDRERNESIYHTARRFLIWLNESQLLQLNGFPILQFRLASALGVDFQLEGEDNEFRHRLSENHRHFLSLLIQGKGQQALSFPLSGLELKSLIHYLDQYLGYHFDGLKPRKSERIFEQYLL